jgi:hypothetical protein
MPRTSDGVPEYSETKNAPAIARAFFLFSTWRYGVRVGEGADDGTVEGVALAEGDALSPGAGLPLAAGDGANEPAGSGVSDGTGVGLGVGVRHGTGKISIFGPPGACVGVGVGVGVGDGEGEGVAPPRGLPETATSGARSAHATGVAK